MYTVESIMDKAATAEYEATLRALQRRAETGIQGHSPFIFWRTLTGSDHSLSKMKQIPQKKILSSSRQARPLSASLLRSPARRGLALPQQNLSVPIPPSRDPPWEAIVSSVLDLIHDGGHVLIRVWYHSSDNESMRSFDPKSTSDHYEKSHAMEIEEFTRIRRMMRRLNEVCGKGDVALATTQHRLRYGFLTSRTHVPPTMTFHAAIIFGAETNNSRDECVSCAKHIMFLGTLRALPERCQQSPRSDDARLPETATTINPQKHWRQRLHTRMRRTLMDQQPLSHVDALGAPCRDSGDIPGYVAYDGCEFHLQTIVYYVCLAPNGVFPFRPMPLTLLEVTRRFSGPIKDIVPHATKADPHVLHVRSVTASPVPLQKALNYRASGVLSVDIPLSANTYSRHSVSFSQNS